MLRPCRHDAAARALSGRFAPIPAGFSAELRELSEDLLQRDPARRPTLDALLARPFVRRHLSALAARVAASGMRRRASFERALAGLRLPPGRPRARGRVSGCAAGAATAAGGRGTPGAAPRGSQAARAGSHGAVLEPRHLMRRSGGRGHRGRPGWRPAGASCMTRTREPNWECSVAATDSWPAGPCTRVTHVHARPQEEPELPGARTGAGACARAAAGASGGGGSSASPGSSGLGPPTPCPAAEALPGFPAPESQASCASSACPSERPAAARAEPDGLAAARTDLVGAPAQAATGTEPAAAPLHAGDTARAAQPRDVDIGASSGCHAAERGVDANTLQIHSCMTSIGDPTLPAAGCLADARAPAATTQAPGRRGMGAEAAAQQRQQREATRRARQAERDAEEAAAAPRVRAFLASGGF